jgi:signal transduction histidine kinase/CheY-like chemotaxis protein
LCIEKHDTVKLRSQILLLLFLFGLAPLVAAIVLNVPLVFDKLELFYYKAYVQSLRADFSDLDQHIARRHETVRLLAKLPEPGMLLGAGDEDDPTVDGARAGYTEWVNQVLFDQLDIIQIVFLDSEGRVQFWLSRDERTGKLEPGKGRLEAPDSEFIRAGRNLGPGGVLTGPISFSLRPGSSDPKRFMTLRFISPIIGIPEDDETGGRFDPLGVVIISIDVGGLARAYPGTYWVLDNGNYLRIAGDEPVSATAFEDFPGLEEIFQKKDLGLWEHGGRQVIWVPLFVTEHSGPLWVGRSVDQSPISEFRHALELRVVAIVLGLLVIVLIVARIIAVRTDRLGHELIDGITRVMERNENVKFSWKRPDELRVLGENLTRLTETHIHNSQELRSHARELEKMNRYKSEFLANVSHELRTPLNSILLLSKMLADRGGSRLTDEEARQARIIHDAGSNLKALIDNILDLSRIDARKATLTLRKINLEDLLEDLVDLLRPQFDEKGLHIRLDIDTAAPKHIVTDLDKLRQILINFLSNAVKFTERGGVTVSVQPNAASESLPVRISVRDSGIGIAPDKQDVIFEAFKQADGSTNRRYGGTGLGLTISRELARLIGGEIGIESAPGKGSTFSLLLPLEFDHSRIDDRHIISREMPEEELTESRIPEADYSDFHILIVDDDVRNLLVLTPLLERWGSQVTAAGDGAEALEVLAEETAIDLVLIDLMMPGDDGYDTIRHIRDQSRYARLPVIALTEGLVPYADRERCLASGADECLTQPVDPSALKQLLDRHLGTASSDRESASL